MTNQIVWGILLMLLFLSKQNPRSFPAQNHPPKKREIIHPLPVAVFLLRSSHR